MAGSDFSIVVIVKNEGFYIREWLAHYLGFGPRKIFVYDNESSDSTADIVDGLSARFPVERVFWNTVDGKSPQRTAYNDALARIRREGDGKAGWALFVDADEFLVETGEIRLAHLLDRASGDPEIGAIAVNQRLFGDSGRDRYEDAPVTSRFVMCSPSSYGEGRWIKSLYRVDAIGEIVDSHGSALAAGRYHHPNLQPVEFERAYAQTSAIDYSVLQLNHYITKTWEEFQRKQARGGVMAPTLALRKKRYEDDGFFHNRQKTINRERCPHADRLSRTVAERLRLLGE
jgi:glycosyltransferase involved in cell wall biosynthesis